MGLDSGSEEADSQADSELGGDDDSDEDTPPVKKQKQQGGKAAAAKSAHTSEQMTRHLGVFVDADQSYTLRDGHQVHAGVQSRPMCSCVVCMLPQQFMLLCFPGVGC